MLSNGLMSLTSLVPADVPSVVQSSLPVCGVYAVKNVFPPDLMKDAGEESDATLQCEYLSADKDRRREPSDSQDIHMHARVSLRRRERLGFGRGILGLNWLE